MGTRIEVKSLTRRFGDRKVLAGVSFIANDGEMVALVGPSGCGKTTLLRIIAGLDTPDEGYVALNDVNADGTPPAARNVGMAFQQFALYPKQTVKTNLSAPLRAKRMERSVMSSTVESISKRLAIDHLLGRSVDRLSGGEQQRVALGRALIRRPSILLLDEPLASIDAALRRDLRELILSLHEEMRTTTIYVTHDAREAASIADRIIVLESGSISQQGVVSELINDPKTIFVIQHASEVPFNVGDGQLSSFREGWILKTVRNSWLVEAAEEKEGLASGPVKFAIHPDFVKLVEGGHGTIERSVREGGRDLLRVLESGRAWWVTDNKHYFQGSVSVQPNMKEAFFFNQEGRRLYLKVLCTIREG